MNSSLPRSTVFIRLNAAAFIEFLAFPMRRLFKRGIYLRAAFISKSVTTVICKYYVIERLQFFLTLLTENPKCLDGVNCVVVASFFLLSSSKRRILLMKCGVYW